MSKVAFLGSSPKTSTSYHLFINHSAIWPGRSFRWAKLLNSTSVLPFGISAPKWERDIAKGYTIGPTTTFADACKERDTTKGYTTGPTTTFADACNITVRQNRSARKLQGQYSKE